MRGEILLKLLVLPNAESAVASVGPVSGTRQGFRSGELGVHTASSPCRKAGEAAAEQPGGGGEGDRSGRGVHAVDRAGSLLYEITGRVRSRRGLNTTYALQPIYLEEHCPQSTSRWQLNSYRLRCSPDSFSNLERSWRLTDPLGTDCPNRDDQGTQNHSNDGWTMNARKNTRTCHEGGDRC